MKGSNIHPVFDRMLNRATREERLGQRARVFWLTGLSGSGKSTLALGLEKKLFEAGFFPQVIDGDNVRSGLNSNLGFSLDERRENIRRIAELSKLYLNSGIITINSFVSPTHDIRALAREIIGAEDFVEVYVRASVEACERRDVKGLYKKARRGELPNFTGISSPYEAPGKPDLIIDTDTSTVKDALEDLYKFASPLVRR